MTTRQPTEHDVHVDSTCSRSHGRALKRKGLAVSAPTGQICTVLPLKYDANGWSGKVLTWLSLPRSWKWMKASPATSLANRVQRSQRMQRSRSRKTVWLIGIGFSRWRFSSTKRLSPGPYDIVWSWRGHSPPLSQTGQSSGWLTSRNSRTPSWAFFDTGDSVSTLMPSVHSIMHEGCSAGPRPVSISTRHMRHMPTGFMRWW